MKVNLYDLLKRSLDIFLSLLGLMIAAPILLIVAFLVRINLGSPVLFRQQRPGKNGHIFELLKFRSMLDIDESKNLVTNEQRITRFGRFLRASSLDEIPSLVNILRGEMSLVGPRPLRVEYLKLYNSEQMRRHEVRPGLTGLAQINGRNALRWEDRFKLDVEYVDNRSFKLDIKILLKTVTKVLSRDGISSEGYVGSQPFLGSTNRQGNDND